MDYRTLHVDGFEIAYGRTARDNDAVTFRLARPNDAWLHAAGHSGTHVIVRRPDGFDDDIPKHVLERAAQIAAWHSKARNARGKVAVHVCRAGDVRKPRGAPAGQVEIRRYEVLKVYPRGDDPGPGTTFPE
jgi:predicted ribosome quality control (RQC) complex YloA/Tae2 family protein